MLWKSDWNAMDLLHATFSRLFVEKHETRIAQSWIISEIAAQ